MTPEEQADILIELFTFSCRECDNAILAALACVDQIVEALDWHPFETPNEAYEFWDKVRETLRQKNGTA